MSEQRRPVRFYHYTIPINGMLWLDSETSVISAEYKKEYDEELVDVLLVEYGPAQPWSAPVPLTDSEEEDAEPS